MLNLNLGLRAGAVRLYKRIAWILNNDLTSQRNTTYAWQDDALWNDDNLWKD